MNINWHDPELYYFLTLLAGIAALLAGLYDGAPPPKGRGPSREHVGVQRWSQQFEMSPGPS